MTHRLTTLSFLVFVGALAVFLANGRGIGAGDSLPARYLPFSLLRQHNFDLDEFPNLYGDEARRTYPYLDGVPYFLRYRDGHYVSYYSPGPAILVLPIYAVPVLAGVPVESWAPALEKLSASTVAALSVVFLFWALAGTVSRGWALAIAMVYAFGTSTWSSSSQALWQHGPSQLFLALSLACLVKGMQNERFLAYAGFALSAATMMRASNVIIALPVAAYLVATRPRVALGFAGLALPPIIGVLIYNLAHFGAVFGGTGDTNVPAWAFFVQVPLLEGLAGTLLSPSRGLFVYSPVLLFSVAGLAWIAVRGSGLFRSLAAGVVALVVIVAKWYVWWGGHSWGPRLLADTTPILCFFLYPVTAWLDRRRLLKAAFVTLAVVSVGAHGLGAFFYDQRWEGLVDVAHSDAPLWSWRKAPLVFYGREAAARLGWRHTSGIGGPTSADSPTLLAASYTVTSLPSEATVGEPLRVSVTAMNTGRAVWLGDVPTPRAHTDPGTVRLGWRWLRDNVDVTGGRSFLWSDVPPGGDASFVALMTSPPLPGHYTLTIDLVSEGLTWFGDLGPRPLRTAVTVRPPDPRRLISDPLVVGSWPSLAISTDRPSYRRDETLRLTIDLRSRHRPRLLDGYLLRQGPDGEVWFYDGREPPQPARLPWVAWARQLPLPASATGRFALPLSDLVPGDYRWYLVLTELRTSRPVSRAATTFSVRP